MRCKVNESGQGDRLKQQAISLHCNEQSEIRLADRWQTRETQGERGAGGGGQEKAFSDGVTQTQLERAEALKGFTRVNVC